MTELVVIRHGETEWNLQGRWQGHVDSPLTERGRAQARAVGKRVANEDFTACYSSDLGRAMETARLILGERLDIRPDERLRERHLGVLQGLTRQQMHVEQAEAAANYRQADYVIPDGESRRQFHDRVIASFTDICQTHQQERILVVTHGGVLDSLFRHCVGLPLDSHRRWQLANAGYHLLKVIDGHLQLLIWGDVTHLSTAGATHA